MSTSIWEKIREEVKKTGSLPLELDLTYTVIFSSLMGNVPVNSGVKGTIAEIPLHFAFRHILIPNTKGSFPVNTMMEGAIGDERFSARMPYTVVFSAIAGNIPVNTGIDWNYNGNVYHLNMPLTWVTAFARGMEKVTVKKMKKIVAPKFIRGRMMEVDDSAPPPEPPSQEAGRPIPAGLFGCIGDIEVNCKFRYSYYINTSSGRNPINTKAIGALQYLPN